MSGLYRSEQCGCDTPDEDIDNGTLALAAIIAEGAGINAHIMGLCHRSVIVAMALAMVRVGSLVEMDTGEIKLAVNEAARMARGLVDRTVAEAEEIANKAPGRPANANERKH